MGNETRLQPGPLHNEDGTLAAKGWATSPVLQYDRSRIKTSKTRIKEWDYYLVNDNDYAVALTIGDLGYIGLISASVMDLNKQTFKTTSAMAVLPLGRFGLPSTPVEGVSQYKSERVAFRFEAKSGQRRIHARFNKFQDGNDLVFEATLEDVPQDVMVISTPWAEDPKAFYYNQKTVAMRAVGSMRLGTLVHGFAPEDSFGLLDWGRGVWTRDNIWYWGVAQGWQDGKGSAIESLAERDTADLHRVGLNIGYGFGDTSAASENMFFVDGVAHKLHRIDFGIPLKDGHPSTIEAAAKTSDYYDLMKPWHMVDDEGRFDVVFTPQIDRTDWMDYKLIRSDQHQVFGLMNGSVVLDDGSTFVLNDLRGSAEVIHNVY